MLLPTIDPGVLLTLHTLQRQRAGAQLLRLLIDGGAVHRRDLRADDNEPLSLANRALNRWLSQSLGGELAKLDCTFRLHAANSGSGLQQIYIQWEAGWKGNLYLGDPLDKLEAEVRGLGASVLDAIETQRVHPMYTTRDAFAYLRDEWWDGKPSERQMLLDHYPNREEREAEKERMVTRAMLDEAVPAWVLRSLKRQKLTVAGLRRVAKRGDWYGAVAAALLRVGPAVALAHAALEEVEYLLVDPSEETSEETSLGECSRFTGFAPVFSWNEFDKVTHRIADEMIEYAMQVESHTHIGEVRILASEPHELRRFLLAMRLHCRAVAALDYLMALLHEGQ